MQSQREFCVGVAKHEAELLCGLLNVYREIFFSTRLALNWSASDLRLSGRNILQLPVVILLLTALYRLNIFEMRQFRSVEPCMVRSGKHGRLAYIASLAGASLQSALYFSRQLLFMWQLARPFLSATAVGRQKVLIAVTSFRLIADHPDGKDDSLTLIKSCSQTFRASANVLMHRKRVSGTHKWEEEKKKNLHRYASVVKWDLIVRAPCDFNTFLSNQW